MANDVKFEGKERRIAKIEKCLAEYGIASLEEARELCLSKGVDAYSIVKGVQPIAFENAGWAYTLGCAVAIKKGVKSASEAAAAIGIGIDVEAPEGNMIVDIGGGSTEIAVISLGGIVSNNSIRIAGDDLTADIQEYMSRQHNVKVSERMAERIKINVGAALTELGEDAPEDYIVHGPNRITALPMEVPVCYQEVAHCLEKSISKIETAILSALENTPPELYADIVHNGIYLAGGGALLRGLDKRLTDKINIPFHIAEDPLHAVAKGTGVALKNVDRFSFLMR